MQLCNSNNAWMNTIIRDNVLSNSSFVCPPDPFLTLTKGTVRLHQNLFTEHLTLGSWLDVEVADQSEIWSACSPTQS